MVISIVFYHAVAMGRKDDVSLEQLGGTFTGDQLAASVLISPPLPRPPSRHQLTIYLAAYFYPAGGLLV